MEPRGSMLHSLGLSNNRCPEPNEISRVDTYFSSHSQSFFPVFLPVKILKALLYFFFIPATWPAHLDLLDLNTLTILDGWNFIICSVHLI